MYGSDLVFVFEIQARRDGQGHKGAQEEAKADQRRQLSTLCRSAWLVQTAPTAGIGLDRPKQPREHDASIETTTSYPTGQGFPWYAWARLLFSGLDAAVVGWHRAGGDFLRPAVYRLEDMRRLMSRPLTIPLAKVTL